MANLHPDELDRPSDWSQDMGLQHTLNNKNKNTVLFLGQKTIFSEVTFRQ